MGVARGGRAHRVEHVRRDVRGGAAGGEDRAGAHTDAAAADGDARPGAAWSAADGEDSAGAGGDGGDGAAGAHASVRAGGDRVGAGGLREDRDGPGGARGVHADAHGAAAPGVAAAPACPHLAHAVHRTAGGRDESAAQRRLHASGPRPLCGALGGGDGGAALAWPRLVQKFVLGPEPRPLAGGAPIARKLVRGHAPAGRTSGERVRSAADQDRQAGLRWNQRLQGPRSRVGGPGHHRRPHGGLEQGAPGDAGNARRQDCRGQQRPRRRLPAR
mmetsp:Transcript_37662/g.111775  ORF Transcript_37662/g.111775 Transcript_37662/m.111775 type:complete len:273 (+) Transcript_37662:748-1566(+)